MNRKTENYETPDMRDMRVSVDEGFAASAEFATEDYLTGDKEWEW